MNNVIPFKSSLEINVYNICDLAITYIAALPKDEPKNLILASLILEHALDLQECGTCINKEMFQELVIDKSVEECVQREYTIEREIIFDEDFKNNVIKNKVEWVVINILDASSDEIKETLNDKH